MHETPSYSCKAARPIHLNAYRDVQRARGLELPDRHHELLVVVTARLPARVDARPKPPTGDGQQSRRSDME